jgi:superfamily II DNA or RNA helicase
MASIIIQNCNQCELDIPAKYALKLYNELSIRHPQSFYLKRRIRDWDGMIHYINKRGSFKIGLLPRVFDKCVEYGLKPKVIDNRRVVSSEDYDPVKKVGDLTLRPEQYKAITSILRNKVGGVPFRIGVIDYTVNAGKSLIMAALYHSFKCKLKTLLITNDSDWLEQSRKEFKLLIPEDQLTFVQGSKVTNWKNFSIGMVQSISRNIKTYQKELSQIDMVLVDEADLAGSKSYQAVLTHLYNTQVRIGLSGTIYMSKLAKDRMKNMNLEAFFGRTLAEFRLADSIKKGYSTKVICKMVPSEPWYHGWESNMVTYKDIYDETITNNPRAHNMVYDRLRFNLKYNRLPALVVCKFVNHCENIYEVLKKKLDSSLNIARVHVNTPDKERKRIMSEFREGRIDILVSTTIIARGKNFPLLRLLINAASMDSQEKSIQFLGRLVRTHASKKRVYLEDLMYSGNYLSRHARHRKIYYKKEKLKVILLDKLWNKHRNHSLAITHSN